MTNERPIVCVLFFSIPLDLLPKKLNTHKTLIIFLHPAFLSILTVLRFQWEFTEEIQNRKYK